MKGEVVCCLITVHARFTTSGSNRDLREKASLSSRCSASAVEDEVTTEMDMLDLVCGRDVNRHAPFIPCQTYACSRLNTLGGSEPVFKMPSETGYLRHISSHKARE